MVNIATAIPLYTPRVIFFVSLLPKTTENGRIAYFMCAAQSVQKAYAKAAKHIVRQSDIEYIDSNGLLLRCS